MEELELSHIKVTEPEVFFSSFTNLEFDTWLNKGTLADMHCVLKVLEEIEHYKFCSITRDAIKELTDE